MPRPRNVYQAFATLIGMTGIPSCFSNVGNISTVDKFVPTCTTASVFEGSIDDNASNTSPRGV